MVLDACFGSVGVVTGIVTGFAEMTGDLFSAMMLIVMILVMLCLALQMPLEVTALFVLPFLIVCYACVPNFTATLGVTLIYLGVILAKNFWIK